jgi:hypothetical protein
VLTLPHLGTLCRHAVAARALTVLAATALATGASPASATAWHPKPAPMSTPWTDRVSVDHPLPEYPRP